MDVQILRDAAAEIAREGHNGWGNLCSDAADEIERLQSLLAKAQSAEARAERLEAAIREHAPHDFWCAAMGIKGLFPGQYCDCWKRDALEGK